MLKRWLFGLGIAALLVGVPSPVVQAGVSIRLNIGVPVKRFHHHHHHVKRFHHFPPVIRQPRVFAPRPFIVAPPGVVHRPVWVPGRWQWTPWGWQWTGGYWLR